MKKLFLTFLLSIFLLPSLVNAGTTSFDSVETENGTISLSIRSNEGFVRGFEVQIEVSGDVWWKSLDFSTSLPQNAIKKYHYNPNNKILKIYITSDNTNENLISNTGIISIGNMKVLGSKNSEYEVKLKSMQTVNMNYQTVTQSLVDPISNKYNYVYVETPEIPEEPVTPENPQEPEKPNDKPNNNDQSTDNSGDSNKPNNGADNNSGNESNGNTSNEEKPKEETPKNPEIKNQNDKENNNYLNTILVIVITLSIGLLIVILCFVFRKKK